MRPICRPLALAPVALVLLTLAPAAQEGTQPQGDAEPLRQPVVVDVRLMDGSPWVGAELRLVSWPFPAFSGHGEPDLVVGTSDARGRVRLSLLRGRIYHGNAAEELGDGRFRMGTRIHEVRCGTRPVVVEQRAVPVRDLKVTGIAGMGRVELVLSGFAGLYPETVIDVQEGSVVPGKPWPRGRWELRRKDGGAIHAGALYPPQETMTAEKQKEPQLIALRNTTRVRFQVVDPSGRPLAGARVLDSLYNEQRVVGTTDAEGVAEVLAARGLVRSRDKTWFSCSFVVSHPGYPSLEVTDRVAVAIEGKAELPANTASVRVQMREGVVRRVRVLRPDGSPWAGLELLARAPRERSIGKARYGDAESLVTNAEGVATLRVHDPKRPVRLLALPAPADLAALTGKLGAANPASVLWLADGELPEEVSFAAKDLIPLRIDVQGHDGAGSRAPLVAVEGAATQIESRAGLRRQSLFAAGRTGRLVLLAHPEHGGPSAAAAWNGLASGTVTGEITGDAAWRIAFPPLQRITGRVSLPDDARAPFAQVQLFWVSRADGNRREGRPERTSHRVRTDAAGNFEILAPCDSIVRLWASSQLRREGEQQSLRATQKSIQMPPRVVAAAVRADLVLDQSGLKLRGGGLIQGNGNAKAAVQRAIEQLRARQAALEDAKKRAEDEKRAAEEERKDPGAGK